MKLISNKATLEWIEMLGALFWIQGHKFQKQGHNQPIYINIIDRKYIFRVKTNKHTKKKLG